MPQGGHDFSLAPETVDRIGFVSQVGVNELDGHLPFKGGMEGFVNLAHGASTELFNDFVVGYSLTDHSSNLICYDPTVCTPTRGT